MLNRTQALVLGFCLAAWLGLIALMVAMPEVLPGAPVLSAGSARTLEPASLIAVTALIGLLIVGVVRRWRWMFWLILIAFLAGALRVPASALELLAILPVSGPPWYEILQGAIGLLQLAIGLAMLSGLRGHGVWGAFELRGRLRGRRPSS